MTPAVGDIAANVSSTRDAIATFMKFNGLVKHRRSLRVVFTD
jgi:hypothetical protein